MRLALFPGSFDPITLGHKDIIDRALPLFDKVYIGVAVNVNKTPMFSPEQRLKWIRKVYEHDHRVEAIDYSGLTAEFCKKMKINYIIRGIRYVSDFEYEKSIADVNRALDNSVDTIFLTCSPEYSYYSSTLVRDIIRNGGNAQQFLPDGVNI